MVEIKPGAIKYSESHLRGIQLTPHAVNDGHRTSIDADDVTRSEKL